MRQIDTLDDRNPEGLTPSAKLLFERHRKDLSEVSRTTADLRDKVRFKASGEIKQTVSHGQSYVPEIQTAIIRLPDGVNAPGTVNEYKAPDRKNVYLAMTGVPKGARVTLWFVPESD